MTRARQKQKRKQEAHQNTVSLRVSQLEGVAATATRLNSFEANDWEFIHNKPTTRRTRERGALRDRRQRDRTSEELKAFCGQAQRNGGTNRPRITIQQREIGAMGRRPGDGWPQREIGNQAVVQWINSSSSRARELISQDRRGFGFLFSRSRVRFREGLDVDWAGKQAAPAMSTNTFQISGPGVPGSRPLLWVFDSDFGQRKRDSSGMDQ